MSGNYSGGKEGEVENALRIKGKERARGRKEAAESRDKWQL